MTSSLLAAALLLSVPSFASPTRRDYPTNNSLLTWKPCDLAFSTAQQATIDAHGVPLQCSNFEVPLDYTDSTSNVTLELQLIRVEASKQPIKGTIFMNPGGPGGSGVEEIAEYGPMYRDVFGGHWNVIGYDAR
jgi:hypothetical protein